MFHNYNQITILVKAVLKMKSCYKGQKIRRWIVMAGKNITCYLQRKIQ